jgi:hypothetical protein
MKTTHLFAALVITLSATGAAMAQQATYEYPLALTSTTTVAAVKAQLQAARADGSLVINEAQVGTLPKFQAQLSREAVRAETLRAAASGEIRELTAEPHGFAPKAGKTVRAAMVAGK